MKFTENYLRIISSRLGNSWLYSAKKRTSNETITINNKNVTSSSLITLTFDSDPDTIDN